MWVLCQLDMIFTRAEAAAFPPPYQPILERFAYTDAQNQLILCWDHGRYVNHSCAPVMVDVGNTFEIAVRDIAVGEELTCEYATLNLSEPMECRCGASGCRRRIGSTDLSTLWRDLDRRVEAALPHARGVPQPLLSYTKDAEQFWAWVDGREPFPSCRTSWPRPADRRAHRRAVHGAAS